MVFLSKSFIEASLKRYGKQETYKMSKKYHTVNTKILNLEGKKNILNIYSL